MHAPCNKLANSVGRGKCHSNENWRFYALLRYTAGRKDQREGKTQLFTLVQHRNCCLAVAAMAFSGTCSLRKINTPYIPGTAVPGTKAGTASSVLPLCATCSSIPAVTLNTSTYDMIRMVGTKIILRTMYGVYNWYQYTGVVYKNKRRE